MSRTIVLPEGARFSCQSCGQCCQGWDVPVDQATVDRLRGHDWGTDPFEPMGTTGYHRIRQIDGRCFFLRPDNHCRIHLELSYEAKPPVCRGFPLSVLEVEGRQYARLSFWCPTVAANTGKPLEQQTRWLKDAATHAEHRTSPLQVRAGAPLALPELDRVHQLLHDFVNDRSVPVVDRIAGAAGLVRRLAEAAEGTFDAVVQQARRDGVAVLASEGRSGGDRSAGRRALSLYLLQDRARGRANSLKRFGAVVLFTLGLAPLSTRVVHSRATWRQALQVAFEPSAVASALLARYFAWKIDARRYVAGESTLVAGVNLLVIAYGLINVLSRMSAASAGRHQVSDDDVLQAVRAADYLAVEHMDLRQERVQRALVDSVLEDVGLCGNVLAQVAATS